MTALFGYFDCDVSSFVGVGLFADSISLFGLRLLFDVLFGFGFMVDVSFVRRVC